MGKAPSSIATHAETFMKRNNDTATNDIARLRGTRFVTTPETEQGKRLSEHLIKQATGNDSMTARFLYGEYFNFVPTFKIFIF
jgi:putative DNA primase/helicase